MSSGKVSRRKFFSTVMVGGAAAAATALTAVVADRQPAPARVGEPRSVEGYRVTAHIQNYYRSTQV